MKSFLQIIVLVGLVVLFTGCGGSGRTTTKPAFDETRGLVITNPGRDYYNYDPFTSYPQGDTYVAIATQTVALQSSVYPNGSEISKVEFFDGDIKLGEGVAVNLYPTSPEVIWTYNLDIGSKQNGKLYQLQARAYDKAGNVGLSKVVKLKAAIQWPQYLPLGNGFTNTLVFNQIRSIDSQGNIFTSANFPSANNSTSIVKLDKDANRQIVVDTINSTGNTDAMLVDSEGSIFIAGGFFDYGTTPFLSKYDQQGKRLWVKSLERGITGLQKIKIYAGAKGGVWLSKTPMELLNFDSNGNLIKTLAVPLLQAQAYNETLLLSDSVVAAGVMSTQPGFSPLVLVVAKYDLSGSQIWSQTVELKGTNPGANPIRLATNSQGDLYMLGTIQGTITDNISKGGIDVFIAKFSSSGSLAWAKQFGEAGDDTPSDLAVDDEGSAYVSGTASADFLGNANIGGNDIFVVKFSSDGIQKWAKLFGTSKQDVSGGIDFLPSKKLLIFGRSEGFMDNRPVRNDFFPVEAVLDQITKDGERTYTPPSF